MIIIQINSEFDIQYISLIFIEDGYLLINIKIILLSKYYIYNNYRINYQISLSLSFSNNLYDFYDL